MKFKEGRQSYTNRTNKKREWKKNKIENEERAITTIIEEIKRIIKECHIKFHWKIFDI